MDGFEFHPHPADIPPLDPNTCKEIAIKFAKAVLMAALALAVMFFFIQAAKASDDWDQVPTEEQHGHPPGDHPIHEQFYATWYRLDTGTSCCNMKDCYPTPMRQKADGSWWALRQFVAMDLEKQVQAGVNPLMPQLGEVPDPKVWVRIPEDRLEHNASREDLPGIKYPRGERDSPDGRSHACVSGDTVFCAVIGLAL